MEQNSELNANAQTLMTIVHFHIVRFLSLESTPFGRKTHDWNPNRRGIKNPSEWLFTAASSFGSSREREKKLSFPAYCS